MIVGLLLASVLSSPSAEPTWRRVALIVGANDGGPGKQLRHAVTDAKAFAKVMESLGGVRPSDALLLTDPDAVGLRAALRDVGIALEAMQRAGTTAELLFYYSGHSDEQGLLLQGQHFSYAELHRALDALPAEFRIAVLDSCQSGAFTRKKGGTDVPPFLLDRSTTVSGEAIITSSSASEASQESDQLGGSFFSHNLISGLRGAADFSHDGKVTLAEAYQFAFDETLAGTESTAGGAQHPAYEMAVSGSGEVVLTDLHATSATLVLPGPAEGRFFIRDSDGHLAVELGKRPGKPVEIGLENGHYTVAVVRAGLWRAGTLTLRLGARTVLDLDALHDVAPQPYATRGDGDSPPPDSWSFEASAGFSLGFDYPGVSVPLFNTTFQLFRTPLVDAADTPLGLLAFVQHPTSLALTGELHSTSATLQNTFQENLFAEGAFYVRPRFAVTAAVGVGAIFKDNSFGAEYAIGVRDYVTPNLALRLDYLGSQAATGFDRLPSISPSLATGFTVASAASNGGQLGAELLLAKRWLLSATAGVGEAQGQLTNSALGQPAQDNLEAITLLIDGRVAFYATRRLSFAVRFVDSNAWTTDHTSGRSATLSEVDYGPSVRFFITNWFSCEGSYLFAEPLWSSLSGYWGFPSLSVSARF